VCVCVLVMSNDCVLWLIGAVVCLRAAPRATYLLARAMNAWLLCAASIITMKLFRTIYHDVIRDVTVVHF